MRKLLLAVLVLVCTAYLFNLDSKVTSSSPSKVSASVDPCQELYEALDPQGVINPLAFRLAMMGYEKITERKRNVLTLIDFSKPSTEERLYVFDMDKHELLFSSVVAHGRNSGDNYARSFSNENGSHKSSLGFYLTGCTYQGSNGYSLRLNGLEKGINDRAYERAVVVHGADYANPSRIAKGGRLGRSWGCPALPTAITRKVIDAIKDGSVMYIYAESAQYLANSSILSDFNLS